MLTVAPQTLPILKGLLVIVLTAHLAFAAALTGGALVSLVFAFFGRQDRVSHDLRLAKKLIETVTLNKSAGLLLVLTLFAAIYAIGLGYPAPLPSLQLGSLILGLLVVGLILIYAYRRGMLRSEMPSATDLLLGSFGVILVFGIYFLLFCGAALLLMPYTWPHLVDRPQLALSWTGTAGFLQFFVAGLAITGAGIRLFSQLAMRKNPRDRDYLELCRKKGTVLALVSLPILPPLLLFDLINLPAIFLSVPVFVSALLAIAIIALMVLHLAGGGERTRKPSKMLLAGALSLVLLPTLMNHAVREEALAEANLPLPGLAEKARPAEEPEKPERSVSAALIQKGREIFETRCTVCHSFERRVVGPPLDEVLPKYRDDRQGLMDFIRSPVKKNPDYPPMPDLGLSSREIEAVAAFLLNRLES